MPTIRPASEPSDREQELEALQTRSRSLEEQLGKLQQLIEGNSNYRNDIIWLAQELNRVQKQIKELESLVHKA